MSVLYQKMKATAQKNAQRAAIVFYGKKHSFARVLSLVERTAEGFKRLGVKKGSVVTLCLPNTPSALIAFYAANRQGAVINLVHPYVSAAGLADSAKKTGSELIIAYDLFLRDKGADLKSILAAENGSEANGSGSKEVTVMLSRSGYFMHPAARLFFNIFQKPKSARKAKKRARLSKKAVSALKNSQAANKKARIKYPVFERLFKNQEIKDAPAAQPENEPAVYLPSGGTAGLPKIIVHRAGVFNELCDEAQFFLSEPLENYKTMYSVLPIFHGFGLCMSMHMCAVVGVKNVMSMKFSPKSVARIIKKERVNVMMGVPAMFARLLECPRFLKTDLSSLKDCFVGGDSVPKGLAEGFNAAVEKQGGRGRLHSGYGLTETVAVCAVNCSRYSKAGSAGYPLPKTRLAVIKDGKRAETGEIGEILVKTPLVMLHYFKESSSESPIKQFEGEDWLFTGDLGFLDKDGFLFFKQRIKSMIKVSGVPVYPCEIEEAAESLPWVVRAAAVGVPDKNSGETVKLYVEACPKQIKRLFDKEPDTETLKRVIIAECEKKLIRYAIPKAVEIRESLPLNDIGKVDRKRLD